MIIYVGSIYNCLTKLMPKVLASLKRLVTGVLTHPLTIGKVKQIRRKMSSFKAIIFSFHFANFYNKMINKIYVLKSRNFLYKLAYGLQVRRQKPLQLLHTLTNILTVN
jgi:hypothetical protein